MEWPNPNPKPCKKYERDSKRGKKKRAEKKLVQHKTSLIPNKGVEKKLHFLVKNESNKNKKQYEITI